MQIQYRCLNHVVTGLIEVLLHYLAKGLSSDGGLVTLGWRYDGVRVTLGSDRCWGRLFSYQDPKLTA